IGPELVDPTLAPLPVGGTTTSSPTVSTNLYTFYSWNLSYFAFLSGTFSYYDPTAGQYLQTKMVPTYLPCRLPRARIEDWLPLGRIPVARGTCWRFALPSQPAAPARVNPRITRPGRWRACGRRCPASS